MKNKNTLLKNAYVLLFSFLLSFFSYLPLSDAAFTSSLDLSKAPNILEVGTDYVLLEVEAHKQATKYRVYYSDKPFRGDETVFIEVKGKNIVLVPGLRSGVRYYFAVVALDDKGNESESFSPSVSLKLGGEGVLPEGIGEAAYKPELTLSSAPTAQVNDAGEVALTWEALDDVSYYKVFYTREGSLNRAVHPYLKVQGKPFLTIGNLEKDFPYHFAVTAVNTSGYESDRLSPEVVMTIPASDTELPTEEALTYMLPPVSVYVDQYRRLLKWEALPGATKYYVWKSKYPFREAMYGAPFVLVETTDKPFWNVSADPEEPLFFVAVQAVRETGERGPLSEPVKIVFPHDGEHRRLKTIFTDVDASGWYAGGLSALLAEQIITPNSQKQFRPGDNVNRAEFSKMLLELRRMPLATLSEPGIRVFCDTDYTAWYGKYVASMTKYGFTKGYPSTACGSAKDFRPGQNVTRAEALKFLFQSFQVNSLSFTQGANSEFADVRTSDWFFSDLVFATRIGLVSGYVRNGQKYYDPHRTITRAEAVQLMYKFMTLLNYSFHQDNAEFLHGRYNTEYRKALSVSGQPSVEDAGEEVRIAWNKTQDAQFYRIFLSPEEVLDRKTKNIAVYSVAAADTIERGSRQVETRIPRTLMPGDFYSIAVLAYDGAYNEALDMSGFSTLTLTPLPNADKAEDAAYTSTDTSSSTTSTITTTKVERAEDPTCSYLALFHAFDTASYTGFVDTCAKQYVVEEPSQCLALSNRTQQLYCFMYQGLKMERVSGCADLDEADAQACTVGHLLKGSTRYDCNQITILSPKVCLYYATTAEALYNKNQNLCSSLTEDYRTSCMSAYAHKHFSPTLCSAYIKENATQIKNADPVASAVQSICTDFHSSADEKSITFLEDERRLSDLGYLRTLFGQYKTLKGAFPVAVQGQCLKKGNEVFGLLVGASLVSEDRFPVDPLASGNGELCASTPGYYWYKSLSLLGQGDKSYVLAVELAHPDTIATSGVLTKEELLSATDFSLLKSLVTTRQTMKNKPLGAKYAVFLSE